MKCKDCNLCEKRGGYQYFFCGFDNSLIKAEDYYNGKTMDCYMTRKEDDEFTEDYIIFNIARK